MSTIVPASLVVACVVSAHAAWRAQRAHRARSRFERVRVVRPRARRVTAPGRVQQSAREGGVSLDVDAVWSMWLVALVVGSGGLLDGRGARRSRPPRERARRHTHRRPRDVGAQPPKAARQQPSGCARRDRPFTPFRRVAGPGDRGRGRRDPGRDRRRPLPGRRRAPSRGTARRCVGAMAKHPTSPRCAPHRERRSSWGSPRAARMRGPSTASPRPCATTSRSRRRCEHRPRKLRRRRSSSASRRSGSRRSRAWPTTARRRSSSRRLRGSCASPSVSSSTRPGRSGWATSRGPRMSAVLLGSAWAAAILAWAWRSRPAPPSNTSALCARRRPGSETTASAGAFVGRAIRWRLGRRPDPDADGRLGVALFVGVLVLPFVPLLAPAASAAAWASGCGDHGNGSAPRATASGGSCPRSSTSSWSASARV